ncbi:DUF6051 family protein [Thermophagus sp. OGC60D27]|uniref:DUF6051 family protein n=1 Tax=Thermophagus sp. OGC60D27 TaxID=3458415 RepID=UPI004037B4EE
MIFLQDLQSHLKKHFNLDHPVHQIDDQVMVHTFPFESTALKDQHNEFAVDEMDETMKSLNLLVSDSQENLYFRYPVFVPLKRVENGRAILLLHGLNERSWEKYLSWAYVLASETGVPVILFPLANHINRSPITWSLPRQMIKVVGVREKSYGKIRNSTFVNAALSERIDLAPGVFVSSGIQSIGDIVKLTQQIGAGNHPLFNKGTILDLFGYSIGAFVAEILLLSNPFHLYDNSRAFFFCGGATFDQMDGRSRTILDDRAFDTLKYFLNHTEVSEVKWKFPDFLIPFSNTIWDVFTSVISLDRFRKKQTKTLNTLIKKIKAIGLKMDHVIPGEGIYRTLNLGKNSNVLVTDFDFRYSHETPFPLADQSIARKVNHAFEDIFRQATEFFKDRR